MCTTTEHIKGNLKKSNSAFCGNTFQTNPICTEQSEPNTKGWSKKCQHSEDSRSDLEFFRAQPKEWLPSTLHSVSRQSHPQLMISIPFYRCTSLRCVCRAQTSPLSSYPNPQAASSKSPDTLHTTQPNINLQSSLFKRPPHTNIAYHATGSTTPSLHPHYPTTTTHWASSLPPFQPSPLSATVATLGRATAGSHDSSPCNHYGLFLVLLITASPTHRKAIFWRYKSDHVIPLHKILHFSPFLFRTQTKIISGFST